MACMPGLVSFSDRESAGSWKRLVPEAVKVDKADKLKKKKR